MGKRHVTNNIRRLRFDAGEMTQKQLAEKSGVTRQTIVAIENAKYAPSLELAFLIALAFDTPLQEVFSYDVKEPETVKEKRQFSSSLIPVTST